MKKQRLYPSYLGLGFEDDFVKYLRLVGNTSKLTEAAYKAASSQNSEYTLIGELRGNIYFPLRNYNTRAADFSLFTQAVVFADLFYDKSEMLFADHTLYECAAEPLHDWAKETKELLTSLNIPSVYCSYPTPSERAKFDFLCDRINWEGFFMALSYITNTSGTTLSTCIDRVMFTSLAAGILV